MEEEFTKIKVPHFEILMKTLNYLEACVMKASLMSESLLYVAQCYVVCSPRFTNENMKERLGEKVFRV